ncbi:MAG: redoxin [Actinobacteria bacterium]|nr:redoxin [Actinomycetota bacterium]
MGPVRKILAVTFLAALLALPPLGAGGAEDLDFTLQSAAGGSLSLGRFRGETPVLLAFWATWCPQCNAEVPAIKDVQSRMSGRLQILAIDFMENREKVQAFIKARNITYPVLLDINGKVARKFRVVGIPTYVLIDKGGEIVYSGNALPSSLK